MPGYGVGAWGGDADDMDAKYEFDRRATPRREYPSSTPRPAAPRTPSKKEVKAMYEVDVPKGKGDNEYGGKKLSKIVEERVAECVELHRDGKVKKAQTSFARLNEWLGELS